MFVLEHFFFLGVGLELDMRWTGVLRSFGPTITFMFGASNKLLNADHHDVYFKGMPL